MDYGASCEISIAFQNNNEFSTHHYVFGYEGYEFAERPIYKRKQKEWDTMFELINGKQFVSNLTQGEIIFYHFFVQLKDLQQGIRVKMMKVLKNIMVMQSWTTAEGKT